MRRQREIWAWNCQIEAPDRNKRDRIPARSLLCVSSLFASVFVMLRGWYGRGGRVWQIIQNCYASGLEDCRRWGWSIIKPDHPGQAQDFPRNSWPGFSCWKDGLHILWLHLHCCDGSLAVWLVKGWSSNANLAPQHFFEVGSGVHVLKQQKYTDPMLWTEPNQKQK